MQRGYRISYMPSMGVRAKKHTLQAKFMATDVQN